MSSNIIIYNTIFADTAPVCILTGIVLFCQGLLFIVGFGAECSEAFFGTNDFYPFVRSELKQHDEKMYELLKKL